MCYLQNYTIYDYGLYGILLLHKIHNERFYFPLSIINIIIRAIYS